MGQEKVNDADRIVLDRVVVSVDGFSSLISDLRIVFAHLRKLLTPNYLDFRNWPFRLPATNLSLKGS